MKILIIRVIAGMLLIGIFAFKVANYEPTKATANTELIQGMYLFIKSKPVMEYDYVGTCKTVTFGSKASEAINCMIKKVKKDFPDANGIIFTDDDLWKADAIKLK